MLFNVFLKSNNTFEGQLPGEKTIAVLRMHWFYFFGTLLGLFLVFIPISVILIAPGLLGGELSAYIQFIASIILLFWWYWTFLLVTMYLLNVWIITDKRIISSTQQGLFNRRVSELSMDKVQDVSVKVEGMFGTVLDFGTLEVQTAGAENKFFLKNIPTPLQIKDMIMYNHSNSLT